MFHFLLVVIIIIIVIIFLVYVFWRGSSSAFCDLMSSVLRCLAMNALKIELLHILEGELCDHDYPFISFCFLPLLPLGKQVLQIWNP